MATILRLLPPAARPTRTAPRPNLLTAAGRCDAGAVMHLKDHDRSEAALIGWAGLQREGQAR